MNAPEGHPEASKAAGDVRPLLSIVRSRVTVEALEAAIAPWPECEMVSDASKAGEYARLAYAMADSGPPILEEQCAAHFMEIMEAAGYQLSEVDPGDDPVLWHAWMYWMLVGYAAVTDCPSTRGAALIEAFADGWLSTGVNDIMPILQFGRWMESHSRAVHTIVEWRALCGICLIAAGFGKINDPIVMNELHDSLRDASRSKAPRAAARTLALRRTFSIGLELCQKIHDDTFPG